MPKALKSCPKSNNRSIWSHLSPVLLTQKKVHSLNHNRKWPSLRVFWNKLSLCLKNPHPMQCDQIWQNFHHFGKYLKFIWLWGKFQTNFGKICVLLGKFSLLKIAKYWKHNLVIWSHCSPMTSNWMQKEI